MKDYKLNFPIFISLIAIFSIIIVGIILVITNTCNFKECVDLLLNYSFVTIPLSLIWLYFQKMGWRSNCWKWLAPILHFPPDIRGRWEGTLDRGDERGPHSFVIEIKQTMAEIKVYSYSSRGVSESIIDSISCDKMENDFRLCFLWVSEKAGNLPKQKIGGGGFHGYTILKLIDNNNKKRLVGDYFTNRKPTQTMGYIDVNWKCSTLKKEF